MTDTVGISTRIPHHAKWAYRNPSVIRTVSTSAKFSTVAPRCAFNSDARMVDNLSQIKAVVAARARSPDLYDHMNI